MMSPEVRENRELISALADGQLRGDEFARVVASLAQSDQAMAAWHAYHVVGDVLRCADLAVCQDDQAFVSRLRGRLQSAAVPRPSTQWVMEADFLVAGGLPVASAARPKGLLRDGANDPVTRWKLLAGVASMAAVAAMGWHLASGDVGPGESIRLTAAPSANPSGTGMAEPPVMLRDNRLDELLAAHKQIGGTSALQMPAGFLRNATFENPGR